MEAAPTTDGIVPDDKDWTWVLDRRCPECGFEASAFVPTDSGVAIRANAAAWTRVLSDPSRDLTARPAPSRWSDLEYAAHVRDVYRLYLVRLTAMLDQDDPLFANWDQDQSAVEGDYRRQDPQTVAGELLAAAESLATAFDLVEGAQWNRPGRRSDGASFTVESFARYMIHDPVHHLWDIDAS